eukprot:TRINITY_DN3019_c0_g1_i2.p1 TRINITY_DN3019_c0_g1~~TRINITY_DN3019_c0_g1_i2.p1  ORF type:complete len:167 (-),score=21.15 TRINITY_DN3019_c0_g1_i2:50-550(-)
MQPQMVFVCMGVSGSGKTSLAEALASRLGWPMYDADDFHPQCNIDKMKRGEALNDEDRTPWLEKLAEIIAKHAESKTGAVLTCSALKKKYRSVLRGSHSSTTRFVFLKGSKAIILERMRARDHFMPASLLDSQFDTLEEPTDEENVVVCNIVRPIQDLVDYVLEHK